MVHAIKSIVQKEFRELINWFSANKYFNEDSFTVRLRLYQIIAFSLFFFSSFYNFLRGSGYSYIISAVACLSFLVIRYLIDRNKIRASYIMMLVSINTTLGALLFVNGTYSGAYLFFFPTIISFAFLTDRRNIGITYLICLGTLLLSVLFAPQYGLEKNIADQGLRISFTTNLLFATVLTVWMGYSLANENNRRQKTLKDKQTFLDTVFNSSLHAELIVDTSTGLIDDNNRHAAAFFGMGNDNVLAGKEVIQLFEEKDENKKAALYKIICSPQQNWEAELNCRKSNNTVFPASVSIISFKYLDKDFKKISITDISEKNQILNELHNAKKKAEESAVIKSQFLSNMSHELRTPLNGIIGASNLLLQGNCLEEQEEQLNVLKFSSEHMLSLINDVLDLSKLDANKIKLERIATDIPQFINSVIAPFIQQFKTKGVELYTDIDSNLTRPVLADPTRLNQVLNNLLSNALKFTNTGFVTLQAKAVLLHSDVNRIEFSVMDTGIGISEEQTNRIFEQFTQADVKTTRKYGGTGLGLTISKKLVELLGGELKVESQYLKGSRFYFELQLPVYYGMQKAYVNNGLILDESKLKGLKILIAEDNPINMMIATKFLDKWGVDYVQAKNGLEAVSFFNHENFDILLLDLEMPEMDGYSALYAIRRINPHIPAIAFTAAVFDNMKQKLAESGFNDYISKPFRPQDLHGKLAAYKNGLAKTG